MLGIALFAAIALRILIPRWQKQPPNKAAALATRQFGARPTGPNGRWTRGDRLRGAGWSATAALGLAAVAWVGGAIGEHTANGSTANMVASGVLFLGAIGLVMALIMAMIHLFAAAFTPASIDARAPNDR